MLTLSSVKGELHAGQQVTLIIRPEMVDIQKTGGKLTGTIRRAVYLGDVIEYDVEIAGQMVTSTETDPTRMDLYPEGTEVTVNFVEDCIQVLPE
jgi:iron(III) transport system ATP-binding protein